MKQFIKMYQFDLYLIGLGLLTYFSFIGILDDFILPIFLIIGVSVVLKRMNIFYLIPLGVYLQMSFQGVRDNVVVSALHIITFTAVLVFDAIYNRKLTKMGKLFYPLSGLVLASLLSFVNSFYTESGLFIWFAGIIQLIAVLAIYYYFVNTTKSKEDLLVYATKMLLYGSVVITAEMLYMISTFSIDPLEVIRLRQIDLGWENLNVIIYTNLIALPLAVNLVLKAKLKIYYIVLALISLLGIFLTLSRSSIGTVLVYMVLIIPYVLIKSEKRVNLILQGLAAIGFVVLSLYLFVEPGVIEGYIDVLLSRDLTRFNDRYELLMIALDTFVEYPIFGSGGIYSSHYFLEATGAKNYHNVIAQASTLGVFGIGAFVVLFYSKTKLLLSQKNDWKWILIILIFVTTFVNGMVQPMYFFTTYLIYIFMLLAIYENQEIE